LKSDSQQRNDYTAKHIPSEGRCMQYMNGGVDGVVIGFTGTDGAD